ncbi:alpha/beta fold hydrolase [Aquimarina sp. 2304DJ70-9]|uniref:alpha/beta fold hydrolase n=1 Tax=Aquimarina penaris TaxID=3231044 RepID=UPI003462A22A
MKNQFLSLIALAIYSIMASSCETHEFEEPGLLVPLTVDQDPSLSSISVNGTQLHSETFGDPNNTMVVFLHGGPGADYRNGLNVSQLETEGFYVVFFDQRGSGLSQRHDRGSYDMDLLLDDLSGVIEYYRTSADQKVFLFGHSWGAILAAGYINKYPEHIDGAIFAEGGGFTSDDLEAYAESSRRFSLFSEATNDVLYYDQFLTSDKHEVLDYKFILSSPFSYARGNDEGIEGYSPLWRYGAVALYSLADIAANEGYDFTNNLNQYTTPVLFLYGELNNSYGLDFAKREAAFFPNSEIAEVAGTGHEMIYFKWNNVEPLVLNYLSKTNQ